MQHISNIQVPSSTPFGGGRTSSDAYRQSLEASFSFEGLEEGANRYDLLLLVKKLGKHAGFTPRMIHLLDYYMAYTRDVDWEEGGRPIVYQSLSRTALDLGVTERQIQKLERALFDAGAVTWNDSGNHRRYGQRDPRTGRILYAYGVDLTPLAAMQADLEDKLRDKQARDAHWMELKRQISWHRAQLRGLLLELREEGARGVADFQSRYDRIAIQVRTHLDIEQMTSLLLEHKSLHDELLQAAEENTAENIGRTQRASVPQETHHCSSKSEQKFVHYKSTTHQSSVKTDTGNPSDLCFQQEVVEKPVPVDPFHASGIDHIKIEMAIGAASERLRSFVPSDANWSDIVEAAYRIKSEMGISQASWGRGCELLGRTGVALCVLITDRARYRDTDPVRSPAAYFNGMLKRAEGGELHLHKSIFGLLA